MVKFENRVSWNADAIRRLRDAARVNSVSVGIPADETYPNGQSVGAVALRQEFGTPRIPPRPFIRPAISMRGRAWGDHVRTVWGTCEDTEQFKEMWAGVGRQMIREIKGSLDRVTDPALSPVTLKRRAARGNPSDKPLVDTGRMREAFAFKVGTEGGWEK